MGPIFGKTYLVAVDSMSKWLEVFQVPSTSADSTVGKLSELWSRWGLPRQIVSDNGPPFTSKDFEHFVSSDGVKHIFTAPYHPSSNGAAENAVKTLKRVIRKAVSEKCNVDRALQRFLLYYRNTDHSTTGESPAVLMMNRRLRTRLDALKPDREAKTQLAKTRQIEAAGGVDRSVQEGEQVWYRNYLKGEKWVPGTVVDRLGNNNFKVKDQDGNKIHRHVDQLKRRSRGSLVCPGVIEAQSSNPSGDSQITPTPTIIAEASGQEEITNSKVQKGIASDSEPKSGLEMPGAAVVLEENNPSTLHGPLAQSSSNSPSSVLPKSRLIRSCRINKN